MQVKSSVADQSQDGDVSIQIWDFELGFELPHW